MELLVLNTAFESIALLDSYESLIWTDRYNEYGDFEIYFPMDKKLLGYLKPDNYLWLNESEHTMIIEDIRINSDVEDGDHLIVTGRSIESILDRRVIYWQRITTGSLQEQIENIIYENIIDPSDADRKIDNFIFKSSADSKVTSLKIDTQFTGDDLYSVVKSVCKENNIGFKVVLTSNNKFEFSLYSGTDRSYDQDTNPYVVFSPNYENIINSNFYSSKSNFKNVSLIGGEGEGSNRRMAKVGSGTGLERREIFTDARDISSTTESGEMNESDYIAQLEKRGSQDLSEHTETTAFEGEVEATKLFKYGEDFFIGDIIQIADGYGNEAPAYISELVISNNDEGLSIYPTFETISNRKESE